MEGVFCLGDISAICPTQRQQQTQPSQVSNVVHNRSLQHRTKNPNCYFPLYSLQFEEKVKKDSKTQERERSHEKKMQRASKPLFLSALLSESEAPPVQPPPSLKTSTTTTHFLYIFKTPKRFTGFRRVQTKETQRVLLLKRLKFGYY